MKRVVSLALTFALIFAAVIPAQAELLYFVAINDTIPSQLSSETMPFYYGGLLYVPHTTFDAEELGVFYSYNASEYKLTLYSRVGSTAKRLTFDLNAGTVSDENNNESDYAARMVGGLTFIPVAFVCEHFSLGCSFLTASQDYPMVRITNGSEKMEDEGFILISKNLVDDKAAKYLAAQNQEVTPSSSVTPGREPQPGDNELEKDPEENPDPEPPEDEPEPYVPRELSLCVVGINQSAPNLMNTYDISAAFFITPDDIDGGDLIRRLYCDGYSLGAAVDMSDAASAISDFEQINSALAVIIKTKTLLVCPIEPENVSKQAVDALTELGCVVWHYGVDISAGYMDVQNFESGINVFIHGTLEGENSAQRVVELSDFLNRLAASEDTVRSINETTPPPAEDFYIVNEIVVNEMLEGESDNGV